MQFALTVSSICYVVLSFVKTMYAVRITKEKEERSLTREAVYQVWNEFVKERKSSGQWSDVEKSDARAKVVAYVHNFESCYCSCYRTRVARIHDWIKEDVENWKNNHICSIRNNNNNNMATTTKRLHSSNTFDILLT